MLLICLAVLLIGIASVSAEINSSVNKSNLKKEIKEDINDIKENIRELKENKKELRKDIKELIRENNGEYKLNLTGKNITIRDLSDNKKEMIINKINARTGLNLTEEDLDNETQLGAWLSNGRHALIKIMPDSASERAIERLKLKVCNESNNCSIELKEVGIGNKTRIAYEVSAQEDSRVLLLFKNKMKFVAQVDGETGEIISVKRPWWAFLAGK